MLITRGQWPEAAGIARGLKPQAMLVRPRFGQRETAVDAWQAGFVGFSDVTLDEDSVFDDSQQVFRKGLFAGSKVKKIEG